MPGVSVATYDRLGDRSLDNMKLGFNERDDPRSRDPG